MIPASPFRFYLWTAVDVAGWSLLSISRGDSIPGWGLLIVANLLLPISARATASRVATPWDIFWLFSGLLAFIAIMIWSPSALHLAFHPFFMVPFVSGMWFLTYRRWSRARTSPLAT